jgi:hypothetical protein
MAKVLLDRVVQASTVLMDGGNINVYSSTKQQLQASLERGVQQQTLVQQQQQRQQSSATTQQQDDPRAQAQAALQAARRLELEATTARVKQQQQAGRERQEAQTRLSASEMAVQRVNDPSFLAALPHSSAQREVWEFCDSLDAEGNNVEPTDGPFASSQLVEWHAGGFFDTKKGFIRNLQHGARVCVMCDVCVYVHHSHTHTHICMLIHNTRTYTHTQAAWLPFPHEKMLGYFKQTKMRTQAPAHTTSYLHPRRNGGGGGGGGGGNGSYSGPSQGKINVNKMF